MRTGESETQIYIKATQINRTQPGFMMIASSPYMNSKLPSSKLKSSNIQLPAQEQHTAEEAAGHSSKQAKEAGRNKMSKKGVGKLNSASK